MVIRKRIKINIFVLDIISENNPKLYHDRHLNKMITESVQLLCTAYWYYHLQEKYPLSYFKEGSKEERSEKKLQYRNDTGLFCPTHINHPCQLWVRESFSNFEWLERLIIALHEEWKHRKNDSGSIHGSMYAYYLLKALLNKRGLKSFYTDKGLTPFAKAMPEKYKFSECQSCGYVKMDNKRCSACSLRITPIGAVEAYKRYYLGEKLFDKNGKPNKWMNREVPEFIVDYCYQRGINIDQFKGAKK